MYLAFEICSMLSVWQTSINIKIKIHLEVVKLNTCITRKYWFPKTPRQSRSGVQEGCVGRRKQPQWSVEKLKDHSQHSSPAAGQPLSTSGTLKSVLWGRNSNMQSPWTGHRNPGLRRVRPASTPTEDWLPNLLTQDPVTNTIPSVQPNAPSDNGLEAKFLKWNWK